MIDARDISVSLGGRRILEGARLQARPGEVTAVIGPNGSGKTTLIKALCKDIAFTGTVMINGRDLSAMAAHEAAAVRAVLPQSSALPFPFTVREVVALGLTAGRSGVSLAARRHLPEDALARVDLDGFAGRFYGELSGGEQQRAQLARVLCQVWVPVLEGVPRYLILDEPVSSLDIRHQLMIMDVARDFARTGGGVIAILHDLNLTALYADSVLALRGGQVAGSGTPQAVLTDALLSEIYDCTMQVGRLPAPGQPFVLPHAGQVRPPLSTRVA